jgi:transcriptional regulator with XRE-family HTH domain
MEEVMTTQQPDEARFAVELKRWRTLRGLSKAALAKRVSVDPSYLSHLESARERGSAQLVRRVDAELHADGQLWEAWQEAEASGATLPAGVGAVPPPSGLLVLDDAASLSFDGCTYHLCMRRRLFNADVAPITRYLVRIAVDKYPGESERSNALYRANPLTWDELGLKAACGGEPMTWSVADDRDAFKEVWLEFSNRTSRFPLYPGQEAVITYSYSVGAAKWGTWFQRAVRLPTRRLSVDLTLPTDLGPVVWGTETSLSSRQTPLRTAIERTENGRDTVFSWSTVDPPLHAHYRLGWRFRQEESEGPAMPESVPAASQLMAGAGVVQEGDPILVAQTVPFDLPRQAEEARQVVRDLLEAVDRIRELHVFGKGMGVAAPQIGIARAAAVVIPPDPGAAPRRPTQPADRGIVGGDRRAVRGLPEFLRLSRAGSSLPADRGGAHGCRWRPPPQRLRAGYGSAGRPRGRPPPRHVVPRSHEARGGPYPRDGVPRRGRDLGVPVRALGDHGPALKR